ncbi:MAG: SRPBCC domain-containing protein [Acidiferrobacterales bacterium]|nr:SRPBCC domain-containing protein [Acidiferrobacterales bacterium]
MDLPFLHSRQGEDPIVMEAEYSAAVSRVYKAWTDPEDICQWFGAGEGGPETAIIDLREGGIWEFTFPIKEGLTHQLRGEYTQVEENKLLRFTWVHRQIHEDGSQEESIASMVTVNFQKTDTGSLIRLKHEGIRQKGSRENVGSGWSMSFGKIRPLVE